MVTHTIIKELERLSSEWTKSWFEHFLLEGLDERQRGFVRHPPRDVQIDDKHLDLFLMISSIQHGGNWFIWLEKGMEHAEARGLLVKTLAISYKRVVFRVLYALQLFGEEELAKEILESGTAIPLEVLNLVKKYVYSRTVLNYLKSVAKYGDEGEKVRADAVIAEISKYSPYNYSCEESQKSKVFISYNHNDSAFVEKLVRQFKKENVGVVIDTDDLKFGENIGEFVRAATANTAFTLSIISKNSIESPWVILEALEALIHERVAEKRKYLPIIIDDSVTNMAAYSETIATFERGIHKLIDEIHKLSLGFNHTRSLEIEKERLIEVRNNFDKVRDRFTNYLYVDLTTEKFNSNIEKLIAQIRDDVDS